MLNARSGILVKNRAWNARKKLEKPQIGHKSGMRFLVQKIRNQSFSDNSMPDFCFRASGIYVPYRSLVWRTISCIFLSSSSTASSRYCRYSLGTLLPSSLMMFIRPMMEVTGPRISWLWM